MAIILIAIIPPGLLDRGKLLTSYEGYNRKIRNSPDELTHQDVKFHKELTINGGEKVNLCFEFKLLNRTFFMALDLEKLYEVIREGDEKIYIRLTESWFYVMSSFIKDNRIVYKIRLTLHYQYTPEAEYYEHFKLQYSMTKHDRVEKMMAKMRTGIDPDEEEMD
jgi:hypothetical protein